MRSFQSGIVALVVLTVSACAFSASPADGLRFQAPAGWRPSPGIMGFMQFWRPPADDGEVLMLFKSPKPLQERDAFSNSQLGDTMRHATIQQRRTIEICGHQPAIYVEALGSGNRGDNRIEMVMTTVAGKSYFAMYARPLHTAPNPMAQTALRELCAKP